MMAVKEQAGKPEGGRTNSGRKSMRIGLSGAGPAFSFTRDYCKRTR
jgi:hypothetical protein